ncbi:MAG: hypothetical protein HY077_04900 [Elusimicrobia bacterium]|nr:hypothetical protein [Elusimicrobiota bacterium]
MNASWLLVLALSPVRAAQVSTGTARLVLIEPASISAGTILDAPLERLLRLSSSSVRLLDIQSVPCYHSGTDYRLRLPAAPGPADEAVFSTMSAVALEAESEAALIFPPEPELISGLQTLAEDPASYRVPWTVRTATKTLSLMQMRGPSGEALVTVQLDPSAGEGAQWLPAVAQSYRLSWRGREVSIVLVAKLHGGLGRLATVLAREQKRGPVLGVARSDAFGSSFTEPKGRALAEKLESLGLKYSAAGSAEVRRWREVQQYRRERPEGIEFLSANLVYASAPAKTILPDHAVVSVGGIKLCLVGMTPPEAAKYLGQGGLADAAVADPVEAFRSKAVSYRRECELVAILGALTPEAARLRFEALGADLIVGEDYESPYHQGERPESHVHRARVYDFDQPLWIMKAWDETLNILEVGVRKEGEARSVDIIERHVSLDESVPWALGIPVFAPETYATALSTEPPILPSARRILPASAGEGGFPQITAENFWTLAAGMLADSTRSEAGLLRVLPLPIQEDTDIPESVVRAWLSDEDQAVVLYLKGSELKALLAEAKVQSERRAKGLPKGSKIAFTAGGVDRGGKIHGVPIEDRQVYRVATTQVLADALGLSPGRDPQPVGRTADELILEGLRKRRGAQPSAYQGWMQGQPVSRRGLWRLDFRDVGLNIQNTSVVRDDAFDAVPNARIQGFNQYTIGGFLKTDADYFYEPYKWSNTVELEYAKTRLRPRQGPPVTNTPSNRIMALTSATRRAGAIKQAWLAQSWGPSLGFQFDSEFDPAPGLPRKQVYSAFPGVELYDGTFVRKWELTLNLKRDQSRDPPNTQGGLHTRMLVSKDLGKAPVNLQGEVYANYFFLTRRDTIQDLRFEGDINFKLKVPIRKYLTVAPFLDLYAFELKLRPLAGYSIMTGISIGFSRLWKPQYESF